MQSEPVSRKTEIAGEEPLPRALCPRTLLVAAVAIAAFIGSARIAVSAGPESGPGDIGLGNIGVLGGPDGFGGPGMGLPGGPGMGFPGGPGMDLPGGPGMDLPEGPGMDCPAEAPGGSPDTPGTSNCDDKNDPQDDKF